MLRYGGGIHIVGGHLVIECELDTGAAARRLRTGILEVYGLDSEMLIIQGSADVPTICTEGGGPSLSIGSSVAVRPGV